MSTIKNLSENQLVVIKHACDVYSRLMIGQLDDALRLFPVKKEIDWTAYHDDILRIKDILNKYTEFDLKNSNLGIYNPSVNPSARVAYDIHQVIRNKVAYDKAIKQGIIQKGGSRKMPEMIQVDYDEPIQTSDETLPKFS